MLPKCFTCILYKLFNTKLTDSTNELVLTFCKAPKHINTLVTLYILDTMV